MPDYQIRCTDGTVNLHVDGSISTLDNDTWVEYKNGAYKEIKSQSTNNGKVGILVSLGDLSNAGSKLVTKLNLGKKV